MEEPLFSKRWRRLLRLGYGYLGNLRRVSWLDDLARTDAGGADADAAIAVGGGSLYRLQIDVPTATGDVVRVTDAITKKRLLAAHFTNLSHNHSKKSKRDRNKVVKRSRSLADKLLF